MVREIRRLSYSGWRDKYRYGDRWMVETFFSGVKRVFGETVRARNHGREYPMEVEMKLIFYNILLNI